MNKTVNNEESLAAELKRIAIHFNENKYEAHIKAIESEAIICAKAAAAAGLFSSITYSINLSVPEISQAILKKISAYGFHAVIKKEDSRELRGNCYSLTLTW